MAEKISMTFEALYEILRKEKYSTELQALDPNFYKTVINYIKEKNKILKSQLKKDSIFAQTETAKTKKQIENTLKLLKEIYEKRESKIIQLALMSSRANAGKEVPTLLPEEKDLYNFILNNLNLFRNNVLNNVLASKPIEQAKKEKPKELKNDTNKENTKLIRFLQPVPKFVGEDLEIYGPFDKEDVGNLPIKVASLLIKKQRAEEV